MGYFFSAPSFPSPDSIFLHLSIPFLHTQVFAESAEQQAIFIPAFPACFVGSSFFVAATFVCC
jgi:hypothetical protein